MYRRSEMDGGVVGLFDVRHPGAAGETRGLAKRRAVPSYEGIHPSSAFLIWTSCSWDPHRHTRNVTGATCRRAASPTGGRSLFLAPSFSSLSPSYFAGVRCRSKAVVLLNTVNPLPFHAALSQVRQGSRVTSPNPKSSCAADASNRKNG